MRNTTTPGRFGARLGASEPSKRGATLRRSLPVGGKNSVTLESSYAVTETLATMPPSAAGAGVTLPADLSGATAAPAARVWSTDRAVKFNIGATGTTLGAGLASSSADSVTHSRLSAEQKLFDALSVTTAVTEPGTPASSKSVSAGFKWKW
jgi:hypothetical protein